MTGRRRERPSQAWRDAAELFSEGVRQTIEFQRRLMDDGSSLIDIGDAYGRFIRSDLAGYGQRVAELTVDYYRDLAEAAREYGGRVWEDLSDRPSADHRPPVRKPIRHAFELSGPEGGEVTRTFTLENTDETAAEVTIDVGVCVAPDGSAFSAPVRVDPDRMTIEPGGSAAVTITSTLDPTLEPDVVYRVPLNIRGPRPAVIDLRLRSTGPDKKQSEAGFTVRCPKCERTFDRKTPSTDLRAHKTPTGDPCPERSGIAVT